MNEKKHKYGFNIETARLGLVTCKENLIYKIQCNSLLTFNGPIMIWSIIPTNIIIELPAMS